MPLAITHDYFNLSFWCVASCCVGWVFSTVSTAVFAVLGMFLYMYIFLMAPVIFPLATMVTLVIIAVVLDYGDRPPDLNNGSSVLNQRNVPMITQVVRSRKIPMNPTAIARLPILGYEKQDMTESMQCAICLTAFEEGESVKQLPRCRHLYHPNCIDQWLFRNCSCPICRDDVEGKNIVIIVR